MKLLFLILALIFSQMILAQPGLLGGYHDVPPSEYENDVRIQRALYYGADEVVQQGIKVGRLPSSPAFKVINIISVEDQVVAGLNYRFIVDLGNGEMTVRAEYVVYSKAGTGELSLTDSHFDITSASNNIPPLIISAPEEEYNQEEGVLGAWHEVKLTTLNTDPNLRNLLNFGVQDILSEEGIDATNYYIEDVVSIDQQVVSGTNTNFSVVLGDGEGYEHILNFTVYDENWTGTRFVTAYEFIANQSQGGNLLGGWESVDVSEVDTDPKLQEILDFGIQNVTAQGILDNQLSDLDYQVAKIYSLKEQLVEGTNYRFNLKLENNVGGYANVIFVVWDIPWLPSRKVTSYLFLDISSAIETSPSLILPPPIDENGVPDALGEWHDVPVTTLNTDSNLRDLLSFGVQNAIVQGIEDEKLPDASYYIEDVITIDQQVVSGTNTNFSVILGDDEGNEITLNFTVWDKLWIDKRDLTWYVVVENQEEEEEGIVGGWQPGDVSEVDTNQYLQGILKFGVQNVTVEGVASGQLSTSDYQVEEIYSIKTQVVEGANYRFNLRLENDAGGFATVIFVVWDRPWLPSREVTSYLFLDIEDAGIEEAVNETPVDGGASD